MRSIRKTMIPTRWGYLKKMTDGLCTSPLACFAYRMTIIIKILKIFDPFSKLLPRRWLIRNICLLSVLVSYAGVLDPSSSCFHFGSPLYQLGYYFGPRFTILTQLLRGYCTPDQFCDCLCSFLKNYNTSMTSNICFLFVTF